MAAKTTRKPNGQFAKSIAKKAPAKKSTAIKASASKAKKPVPKKPVKKQNSTVYDLVNQKTGKVAGTMVIK